MNESLPWSRLHKFYELSPNERREVLLRLPVGLERSDFCGFEQPLPLHVADSMSENVIGAMSLPFSVAANFVVNKEAVLVPMVTEEPSIVAAVSKMAKIISATGGFSASISEPIMKGQVQLYGFGDIDKLVETLEEHKAELKDFLNSKCENMVARGGGVIDIGWRALSSRIGPMLIVEPLIDVRDAMGANLINTLMEHLAAKFRMLIDAEVGIAILSNFCDSRLAFASCSLPWSALLSSSNRNDDGQSFARRVLAAHVFAEADVYRACTHNKGVLNGIDAVALATGNDFRAIEAGAHAYAARCGTYRPLTSLTIDEQNRAFYAEITLPLAVGVVGGNCAIHEGVRVAHKLLGTFSASAKSLAAVMASVGLAQCLAALCALAGDGIQKGHMKLHNKKMLKSYEGKK